MLLTRMLAGAILIHEALYVFRDGHSYLTSCFLPTLGLQLGPRAHAWLHAGLMGACAGLIVMPAASWLLFGAWGLLSLAIASYSLRLSNHLVLAWFMIATICLARMSGQEELFVSVGVRGFILLTYALACFHKLNSDYFSPEHSSASQLVDFYCWDRGVVSPWLIRLLRMAGIQGTVLAEGALPVLLVLPGTLPLGLTLALTLHFGLALLGIVNFSAMMYAGLTAFVPERNLFEAMSRVCARGALPIAAACVFAMVLVWALTPRRANRHCPYVMRAPAWLVQFSFGAGTTLAAMMLVELARVPVAPLEWTRLEAFEHSMLAVLWVAFLVNGISPYLGFKTEFSFAMFSNLRSEPWRHLLFPAGWRIFHRPRYVRIEYIEGLPPLSAVQEDPGARLALKVLSQPDAFQYTRYFLREALLCLGRIVPRGSPIRVRYVEQGSRHELDGHDPAAVKRHLDGPSMNLFPFVMPIAPEAPHSEQGTVLNGQEKQLF